MIGKSGKEGKERERERVIAMIKGQNTFETRERLEFQ
jgi:hypothetical protein